MRNFILSLLPLLFLGSTAVGQNQTGNTTPEIVVTAEPFFTDTIFFGEQSEIVTWESGRNGCSFDFLISYFCGYTTLQVLGCEDCTSFALTNSVGQVVSTGPTATLTQSGTYTMTVMGVSGCTGVATINVTVQSAPSTAVAFSGPLSFCQGGSVTLTASPATSYQWSNGATTQSITVTSSGTYWVTASNGPCSATSNAFAVTVNPLPNVVISVSENSGTTNDGVICVGANATLTASGGNNFQWSTGQTGPTIGVTPTTTTTYNVTVNNSGCIGGATRTIVVNALPAIPTITPYVVGQTVTLSSSVFGSFWYLAGQQVGVGQNFNPSLSGVYSVTTSNQFGCSATSAPIPVVITICIPDTVTVINTVTVYQDTCIGCNLTVTTNPINPICAGSNGSISAIFANAQGLVVNFLWSNGATTQNLVGVSPGTYCVTVTDGIGCTATSCSTISSGGLQSPNASFGHDEQGGVSVFFFDQSSGATSWLWNFGDGSPSITAQNPGVHVFPGIGLYAVTLTVWNDCGTSTTIQQVTIDQPEPSCNQNGITNNYAAIYGDTLCLNSGQLILTAPGNPATTSYQWSGTGDLGWGQYFPSQDPGTHFYSVWVTPQNGVATQYCFQYTVSCELPVTGTDDIEFRDGPAVFPNPTLGPVTLDLSSLPAGTYMISVMDQSGKLVTKKVIKQ